MTPAAPSGGCWAVRKESVLREGLLALLLIPQVFIAKEPASKEYFKKWIGSDEFINGKKRYCLWLGDCEPADLKNMPECLKRVEAVRKYRLASKSRPTRKLADKPRRFHVENMPKEDYIVIPKVSSESRYYIPIGLLSANTISSDLLFIVPLREG